MGAFQFLESAVANYHKLTFVCEIDLMASSERNLNVTDYLPLSVLFAMLVPQF